MRRRLMFRVGVALDGSGNLPEAGSGREQRSDCGAITGSFLLRADDDRGMELGGLSLVRRVVNVCG